MSKQTDTRTEPRDTVAPPGALSPESTSPTTPALGTPPVCTFLDLPELIKQFGELPSSQWPWGVPQEVRVKALHWKLPKKCTFDVCVLVDTGQRHLIAKVYAKVGEVVYKAMEELWRAGFNRDAEASIAEPIAYMPTLRLLLQEKVEGLKAQEVFQHVDERSQVAAAERCARWLARFHALGPRSGPLVPIEMVLRKMERRSRVIAERGGDMAAKSERLFRRFEAAARNLETPIVRPCHGDFGIHNIIFEGKRTVAFDLDNYGLADPARDVARFIVKLERTGLDFLGSIRAVDRAVEAFIKTYVASGGAPVAERVSFYKAAYYVWNAKKDVTIRVRRLHERADVMLDEGLRTLE
jgi:aminoglycoside phosphotransferase